MIKQDLLKLYFFFFVYVVERLNTAWKYITFASLKITSDCVDFGFVITSKLSKKDNKQRQVFNQEKNVSLDYNILFMKEQCKPGKYCIQRNIHIRFIYTFFVSGRI